MNSNQAKKNVLMLAIKRGEREKRRRNEKGKNNEKKSNKNIIIINI